MGKTRSIGNRLNDDSQSLWSRWLLVGTILYSAAYAACVWLASGSHSALPGRLSTLMSLSFPVLFGSVLVAEFGIRVRGKPPFSNMSFLIATLVLGAVTWAVFSLTLVVPEPS